MDFIRRGVSRVRKTGSHIYIEIILVCLSALTGISVLLLAVGGYSIKVYLGYLSDVRLVMLNIVPVILFTLLLYAVVGRAWFALLLSELLAMGISLCNYYKLIFRDDPLMFEDIVLLREAANMTKSYTLFVDVKMAAVMGSIVVITALMYMVSKGEKAGNKKRVCIAITVILLGVSVHSIYQDAGRYNAFRNYEVLNQFSGTQAYVSRGFFYPFIHSMFQYKEIEPDGYHSDEVENLLAQKGNCDIPVQKRVHIIAVMREAYSDFSQYHIAGFKNESFDLFHQLQEESYSGYLYVNAFGGGTIDTERSFLMGTYKIKDNIRGNSNSYVWYLKEQGYTVEGSHPFYQWFYNRRNVNAYLGFDRYRFYEDTFGAMTGNYYPEDELFYKQIYQDYLENKASGKPYFSFNVNVQSHGPYSTEYRLGDEEFLVGEQYSIECKNAMDNYMYIISDSDEELIEFIHLLEQEEDPIVFILFSDHLPWMGDGNAFYTEMGIDFSEQSEELDRLQYTTEYLLWANESAKEVLGNDFVGQGPTISPCYLMNVLFEQCSWEGPAYMQVMDEMRNVFSVVSTSGKYIIDDVLTYEISEERKDLYKNFENIQFYWRNHFLYENVTLSKSEN
ncbi:MAG: sulfatase-like hydrolase/transferase [Lachnospiraceae bacterium]|nr:sulfatase-like hydrolase/transferase [Lachnospiraceae bacterium]